MDPYRDDSGMYDSPMRGQMNFKDQYDEMMNRSAGRVQLSQANFARREKANEEKLAHMEAERKKLEKKDKEKQKK